MTQNILEKSALSYKAPEGPQAIGQKIAELDGLGLKQVTVIGTEKGQSYKIINATTKQVVKPAKVERLDRRIEVRLDKPYAAGGYPRINCTVPAGNNRWRWFGYQFYVPGK